MHNGSCQQGEFLRVAASSNESIDTDVQSAGFAGLLSAGHLRRDEPDGGPAAFRALRMAFLTSNALPANNVNRPYEALVATTRKPAIGWPASSRRSLSSMETSANPAERHSASTLLRLWA